MSGPYCHDWHCPARASCAHFFGRSADYAGMRETREKPWTDPPRAADAEACPSYRRDRPRAWLRIDPNHAYASPLG